ncbi:unnamed protein product [Phaedon cochleariae]|uniref:Uncharacterized protein n=1 Tax=Phaedon cochleariae TaxID=80249 RepID=A0A9P0DUN2_PHACE|nr:unnamed protein product [Phaedon cochleariae]
MFQNKEIMELCEMLAEHENLKVSIKEATKGAFCVGFGAFAGALLAGPVGLAVGGTIASVTTAWRSRYSYRSVVDVLRNDLTPEQKRKLVDSVQNLISKIKPEDCLKLLTLVLTNASLKEAVLTEIGCFLLKEMRLQMIR